MKEVTGDLWAYHAQGAWVVITTNGIVAARGTAVMGRGVAQQAAQRFPLLPRALAMNLTQSGNHVYAFPFCRVITFPVKAHWRDRAAPGLIRQSVKELVDLVDAGGGVPLPVYLVRPGCGNGGLRWAAVKPLLAPLDDRFVVVEETP